MQSVIVLQVLIATSLLAIVKAELRVTQLQVLFRHGERTPRPEEMYPNDIHNISTYDLWGIGQLTNSGKMREYKIGQVLKTRYQELLASLYVPTGVHAVSTDVDRTKASLQLVLAGLFPPSETQMWNPELPWTPIPTHYVPEPLDALMKSHMCPQFAEAVSQARELPEVLAKVAAQDDLYDFLTEKTGLNITGPNPVQKVYNLLVAQKALNLTLPDWCTDAVFQEMGEATILEYQIRSYTPKLKRINGGPMVKKFIENMHLDREQENPRKLYLYSAHEVTVSAFLQAHGILDPKIPHYGTAVMIEKLENSEGKLFVRFVLWTGVTEHLITLQIPGCEEICPIERYLQLTEDVIPSSEELDCHWRRLSAQQIRDIFSNDFTYDT